MKGASSWRYNWILKRELTWRNHISTSNSDFNKVARSLEKVNIGNMVMKMSIALLAYHIVYANTVLTQLCIHIPSQVTNFHRSPLSKSTIQTTFSKSISVTVDNAILFPTQHWTSNAREWDHKVQDRRRDSKIYHSWEYPIQSSRKPTFP